MAKPSALAISSSPEASWAALRGRGVDELASLHTRTLTLGGGIDRGRGSNGIRFTRTALHHSAASGGPALQDLVRTTLRKSGRTLGRLLAVDGLVGGGTPDLAAPELVLAGDLGVEVVLEKPVLLAVPLDAPPAVQAGDRLGEQAGPSDAPRGVAGNDERMAVGRGLVPVQGERGDDRVGTHHGAEPVEDITGPTLFAIGRPGVRIIVGGGPAKTTWRAW